MENERTNWEEVLATGEARIQQWREVVEDLERPGAARQSSITIAKEILEAVQEAYWAIQALQQWEVEALLSVDTLADEFADVEGGILVHRVSEEAIPNNNPVPFEEQEELVINAIAHTDDETLRDADSGETIHQRLGERRDGEDEVGILGAEAPVVHQPGQSPESSKPHTRRVRH